MHRGTAGLKRPSDEGFSIIESMVALAFLAIVFTIAAGVLASSLGALGRARVEAMASNLGQALIEEIRLVGYSEVGTLTGSPQGVFPDSRVVDIDGRTFDVVYQITYEGSATGLDIINPGTGTPSGDGTGSAFDSGIDYKRVQVTITDRNGRLLSPTVFETLVAPPDIAANEGLANVRVRLVKADVLVDDPTPLPQVCISNGANSFTGAVTASGEAVFIGIPPNGNNPAFADYWYTARIGAGCGTIDALSGWMILPEDLTAEVDRVNVAPTATGSIDLTLTKAEQLELSVVDTFGDPLDATAEFRVGATSYEVDVVGGSATVVELAPGVPLTAGTYDLLVRSPGYSVEVLEVDVPYAGVLEVVLPEVVTFVYELEVVYADGGYPVPNTHVQVTGGGIDVVEFTDASGDIRLEMDGSPDEFTVIVDARNGLVPQTFTGLQGVLPTQVSLSPPPGWGFVRFAGIGDKGSKQFRIRNRYEANAQASPDVNGDFIYVAPAGDQIRAQHKNCHNNNWNNVSPTGWATITNGGWITRTYTGGGC